MKSITPHQLKYLSWEITKKRTASDSDRLSQSLFDAQVDVNPHQIEAALFALNNPLSRGVVLADEVGLGKTIEAALVLCQYWAESRRNLLIIAPAALRKQWGQELQDKFNLPVQVLDFVTWKKLRQDGIYNPFDNKKISIISYNFAMRMEYELGNIPWDLVVIDEAHRLRNAHRTSNKIGNSLKKSLIGRKKLLLTATPLQNSLMELYGLSTVIDEHLFGDDKTFRQQYVQNNNNESLKRRLGEFMQRTLRKDVLEYVPYTERHALTVPFEPSEKEQRLYELISSYLQRDFSYAFPQQQRHLIAIILRKLLASSTPAVIATLESIRKRLQAMVDEQTLDGDWLANFITEDDLDEELLEEIEIDEGDKPSVDMDLLTAEIAEIDHYLELARQIHEDEKSFALLSALEQGFARMFEMNASRKAVIFTESRRTQDYLMEFLQGNGFANKVIAFNGTNSSTVNTGIYQKWLAKNFGSDKVTGSPAIDRRTALIDAFREDAEILIATEAAAEGVNLQFCSLVINYDLPWNPQRVEQRIGRCHRYGQKFDVVVVNFLNERNAADRRVLELLTDKFSLFNGVFGASNEILGTIESGVDFEQRIAQIYDQCRTPEEIEASFRQLREDLQNQINQRMQETRDLLLKHFDADIHDLLKIQKQRAEEQLDRVSQFFWIITQAMLAQFATFGKNELSFVLHTSPMLGINTGRYQLIRKGDTIPEQTYIYRLTHQLGEYVLNQAKNLATPNVTIEFDYTHYPQKVSSLDNLIGQSGWLAVNVLTLQSFDIEEHLIITAMSEAGEVLAAEVCQRLMRLDARVIDGNLDNTSDKFDQKFLPTIELQRQSTLNQALQANQVFFQKEQDKIDQWAEDKLKAAEIALEDIKIKVRSLQREARQASTMEEQHQKQEAVKQAEKEQRRMRQTIFDVEDEISAQRDALISSLENALHRKSSNETLFMLRWEIS
ncbi:SNF2-related protein [Moraxella osloensis]|nr:SNF2-related protein [Moraxella osloensis]MDK1670708.1 SNF2-related protein [Moraxella osloensis]